MFFFTKSKLFNKSQSLGQTLLGLGKTFPRGSPQPLKLHLLRMWSSLICWNAWIGLGAEANAVIHAGLWELFPCSPSHPINIQALGNVLDASGNPRSPWLPWKWALGAKCFSHLENEMSPKSGIEGNFGIGLSLRIHQIPSILVSFIPLKVVFAGFGGTAVPIFELIP